MSPKSKDPHSEIKYQFGDWVTVVGITKSTYDDTTQPKYKFLYVDRFVTPKLGRVVGVTFRQEGKYHAGYGSDDDYESGWIQVDRTITVWQVKFGLRGRTWDVYGAHLSRHMGDPADLTFPYLAPSLRGVFDRPFDLGLERLFSKPDNLMAAPEPRREYTSSELQRVLF